MICAWCGNPINPHAEDFADHGGYQIHHPVCTAEWDEENDEGTTVCPVCEQTTCACDAAEPRW